MNINILQYMSEPVQLIHTRSKFYMFFSFALCHFVFLRNMTFLVYEMIRICVWTMATFAPNVQKEQKNFGRALIRFCCC